MGYEVSGNFVTCPKCKKRKAWTQNHWGSGWIYLVCTSCGLHLYADVCVPNKALYWKHSGAYRRFEPKISFINTAVLKMTEDQLDEIDLRDLINNKRNKKVFTDLFVTRTYL